MYIPLKFFYLISNIKRFTRHFNNIKQKERHHLEYLNSREQSRGFSAYQRRRLIEQEKAQEQELMRLRGEKLDAANEFKQSIGSQRR